MDKMTDKKEVNLIEMTSQLFNWLLKIGRELFTFTGKLLQLGVKHWVVFLLSFLLIVAGSLYLSRESAHKYKVGTMLHIAFTDAPFIGEMIDNLANSDNSIENLSIAKKLNIPDSVGGYIQKIKHFKVIDYLDDQTVDLIDFDRNHDLSDTTNLVMKNKIYLQFVTRKPKQLDTVYAAMMRYFNENSYVLDEYNSKMRYFDNSKKLLQKELERIDSLADKYYFSYDKWNSFAMKDNNFIIGENRPHILHEELIRVINEIEYRENILETNRQPVYTTTGFIVSGPINNRRTYGIYGIVLGVLFGVLNAYICENRKRITSYLLNK